MAENTRGNPVYGRDGLLGWVDQSTGSANSQDTILRLENGLVVRVPAEFFIRQPDGSFYLPMSRSQFEAVHGSSAENGGQAAIVIPVLAEEIEVSKRQVTSGQVKVSKHVSEHEETVDVPLARQEVKIERVAIDQIVSSPPQVRYEGDTMIIPVLEEELVVEKRLRLKEEVRVTRIQQEVREPQQVRLRQEEVEVQRTEDGERDQKEK